MSLLVQNLTNGNYYPVAVRARNSVGYGPYATADIMLPLVISIVSAIKDGASITITFTAGAAAGVTLVNEGGNTNITQQLGDLNIVDDAYTLIYNDFSDDFAIGSTITLQLTAEDASVITSATATLVAPAVATSPGPPTNISCVVGNGSITVSFSAPINDGGAAITGYVFNAGDSNKNKFSASGTSSPITITGLTNGVQYIVEGLAVNSVGAGFYSTPTNATPVAGSGSGSGSGGGGSGSGSGTVPCFFGDAPVLTAGGYVRMDSLKEGDKVMTPEGAEVVVERAKCYRVAAGPDANPYVIPKGRFGATEDLLISPDHRVQTEEGMVPAKELGLEQEEREGYLTYYNLELADGANMVVAGVAVESLAPVRRMVVPRAVFEKLIAAKYGNRTAEEISAMIARTCRMLDGDRVDIPVMRRR
jgi:hypothetical protein